MEFEGLLLALIVGMAVYIILNRSDQRHPGHRFGQQNPNQPYYGDDYDDYDNYQQPNYPQQYGGGQPIIIMGGGYPYPPRHYREDEGRSLPAVMLVILVLAIGAAVYYRNAPEKKVVYVPYPNSEQTVPEREPSEQTLGNPEQMREQKATVIPIPPTSSVEEKTERFRPTKNSHVVYLGDYTSPEGVRALMDIYPKKKIVGVEINGIYWACVLVKSEDAAWDEMRKWKQYDNDYRRYGLDLQIRDLRDYCNELSWNAEHDMLICD